MIDIEKFICDVYDMASARANHELCHVLDYAFRKQGIEYINVEPKKELTEFENRLCEIVDAAMQNPVDNPNTIIFDVKKKLAPELLELAQKQLQEEFDKQLELAYKNADKVQYGRGYKKAIEDAAGFIYNNMAGDDNSIRYFHTFMEQKLKELSQG